ncbi:MAG: 3-dehydroquinate synthase [Candidatus Acidiferrales bacterium]
MKILQARTSSGSYPILCGKGALARAREFFQRLGETTGAFVVTPPKVAKLWATPVKRSLRGAGRVQTIFFNDAEEAKRMSTVEGICRKLARAGADRKCVLVALGGGVTGDVVGFVAATYLRGVRVVQVPTTLVGQVDSAVGGKTGVNLPEGKNLLGSFYQPSLVVADPQFLRTLPEREYRSGIYEIVKYGAIRNAELFEYCEANLERLLRREEKALEFAIGRSLEIKIEVVRKDERECGLREILNFGHTMGHALEATSSYRKFLHGEAIGWGMIGETLVAAASGRLNQRDGARILSLVARVGALPAMEGYSAGKLIGFMRGDKKSRGGEIRWALPRRIGKGEFGIAVPEKLVAQAIREAPRFYGAARRAL